MLRTAAVRPILKSISRVSSTRSTYNIAATFTNVSIKYRSVSNKRPRAITSSPFLPTTTPILRYATAAKPPYDKADTESERKTLNKTIQSHPAAVSEASSVRQVFEGKGGQKKDHDDADMLAGMRGDLETIKDTFRLTEVPRESYYIGAAGVLPYLATSLSTVFLAWDINHAHATGSGFLVSPETAHQLLALLEPIQIGYGAVIISFLGAIHWGLEYAGYGGHHSYRRYAIGIIAPAVAWPTMLMPVEYALITQFLAFNFLYFADARATVRGWAPPWYSTYRFVLTFVVGASIVVSLIGRGQIASPEGKLPGPAEKMKALRDSQWENLEREERERRKALVEADESEDEGEDDGEKDDGEDSGEKDDEKKDDEKKDDGKKDDGKKDGGKKDDGKKKDKGK